MDEERLEKLNSLNEAERETLELICRGVNREEIAQRIDRAESTVYYRQDRIYLKLGLDNLDQTERLAVLLRDYCPLLGLTQSRPVAQTSREPLDGDDEPANGYEADRQPSSEMGSENEQEQSVDGKFVDVPGAGPSRDEAPTITYVPADSRDRVLLRRAIIAASIVLGAFAILLAMNLIRRPQQPQAQVIVVTATSSPTSSVAANTLEGGPATAQPVAAQATYTPYPTSTPMPTYTPFPSPTVGQLPTGTPRPTYTLYPTQSTAAPIVKLITWTPVPSPTVPENTPQGTVLGPREWWKQGGVWLQLSKWEMSSGGTIYLYFEVWNKTESTLYFNWTGKQNFALSDNYGRYYGVHGQHSGGWNETFGQNQRRIIKQWLYDATVAFDSGGQFYDSDVTELNVHVTDLSRIVEAEFRIQLAK